MQGTTTKRSVYNSTYHHHFSSQSCPNISAIKIMFYHIPNNFHSDNGQVNEEESEVCQLTWSLSKMTIEVGQDTITFNNAQDFFLSNTVLCSHHFCLGNVTG